MKTSLWLMSVFGAVGVAGLFGCAQQQLGGGLQQQTDGAPGDDAGCGPLGKMVCVYPLIGCPTTTPPTTPTPIAPVCRNGSWTCPPDVGATQSCEPPVCVGSLPRGCTCDVATGVTTCVDAGAVCPGDAPDGSVLYCVANCSDDAAVVSTCSGGVWSCPPGTVDIRECARDGGTDAGTGCPPNNGQNGAIVSCVNTCNIDAYSIAPVCANGAWVCPSGHDVRTCCRGTAPPGCTCDALFSTLTCSGDGGADAASSGHGG
jgi:hypothetical protein